MFLPSQEQEGRGAAAREYVETLREFQRSSEERSKAVLGVFGELVGAFKAYVERQGPQ